MNPNTALPLNWISQCILWWNIIILFCYTLIKKVGVEHKKTSDKNLKLDKSDRGHMYALTLLLQIALLIKVCPDKINNLHTTFFSYNGLPWVGIRPSRWRRMYCITQTIWSVQTWLIDRIIFIQWGVLAQSGFSCKCPALCVHVHAWVCVCA